MPCSNRVFGATPFYIRRNRREPCPQDGPILARALTSGRWVAVLVLLAGDVLPPLDFFIVNVSLPSIHASLGATPAEVQLVVSGYAAGYALLLITGGRLGDLFGRRRLFLWGMTGITAANGLCGLAHLAGCADCGKGFARMRGRHSGASGAGIHPCSLPRGAGARASPRDIRHGDGTGRRGWSARGRRAGAMEPARIGMASDFSGEKF